MLINGPSWRDIGAEAHHQHPFDFEDYFTGESRGNGIVQNFHGRITRGFSLVMRGSWQGDGKGGRSGILEEFFHYQDGEQVERVWRVARDPQGQYSARADDIIGSATSETSHSIMRWHYLLRLPVKGRALKIRFDDWMYLLDDGVLLNASSLSKFGITLARLSVVLRKTTDNSASDRGNNQGRDQDKDKRNNVRGSNR